jgi:hypothetical protein
LKKLINVNKSTINLIKVKWIRNAKQNDYNEKMKVNWSTSNNLYLQIFIFKSYRQLWMLLSPVVTALIFFEQSLFSSNSFLLCNYSWSCTWNFKFAWLILKHHHFIDIGQSSIKSGDFKLNFFELNSIWYYCFELIVQNYLFDWSIIISWLIRIRN